MTDNADTEPPLSPADAIRPPDNVVRILPREPCSQRWAASAIVEIPGHSQERRAIHILGRPVIERVHTFPSRHGGAPLPSTQRHRFAARAVTASLIIAGMVGGAPTALRTLGLT